MSAEDPGTGGAEAQGLVMVCEASLHGRINMGIMVEQRRGSSGADDADDAGVPREQ